MTLKVSTATGNVQTAACLPEQDIFIVRNICKTCVQCFPCSFTLAMTGDDHVHGTVAIYIAWGNDHM